MSSDGNESYKQPFNWLTQAIDASTSGIRSIFKSRKANLDFKQPDSKYLLNKLDREIVFLEGVALGQAQKIAEIICELPESGRRATWLKEHIGLLAKKLQADTQLLKFDFCSVPTGNNTESNENVFMVENREDLNRDIDQQGAEFRHLFQFLDSTMAVVESINALNIKITRFKNHLEDARRRKTEIEGKLSKLLSSDTRSEYEVVALNERINAVQSEVATTIDHLKERSEKRSGLKRKIAEAFSEYQTSPVGLSIKDQYRSVLDLENAKDSLDPVARLQSILSERVPLHHSGPPTPKREASLLEKLNWQKLSWRQKIGMTCVGFSIGLGAVFTFIRDFNERHSSLVSEFRIQQTHLPSDISIEDFLENNFITNYCDRELKTQLKSHQSPAELIYTFSSGFTKCDVDRAMADFRRVLSTSNVFTIKPPVEGQVTIALKSDIFDRLKELYGPHSVIDMSLTPRRTGEEYRSTAADKKTNRSRVNDICHGVFAKIIADLFLPSGQTLSITVRNVSTSGLRQELRDSGLCR